MDCKIELETDRFGYMISKEASITKHLSEFLPGEIISDLIHGTQNKIIRWSTNLLLHAYSNKLDLLNNMLVYNREGEPVAWACKHGDKISAYNILNNIENEDKLNDIKEYAEQIKEKMKEVDHKEKIVSRGALLTSANVVGVHRIIDSFKFILSKNETVYVFESSYFSRLINLNKNRYTTVLPHTKRTLTDSEKEALDNYIDTIGSEIKLAIKMLETHFKLA